MDIKISVSSFAKSSSLDETIIYDLLIIGGGPAALNAALYALRKKMVVALVTDDIGGQIAQSDSIDNWLGDQHLKSTNLVNRFFDHVKEHNLQMKKGIKVTELQLETNLKKVVCSDKKTYKAKSLIIATGKSPRKMGIPGEDKFLGRGVAYCTICDGPAFQDKKIIVVGGGNSGVEAALDMLNYASQVVLVQNLSKLTADQILVDKVLNEPRISVVYNSVCLEVKGQEKVEQLIVRNIDTEKEQAIDTDAVFVEIGLIPASRFLSNDIKTEQGEIIVDAMCATKIPGVFAAGDVTNVPYKQVVIAAGEGAKAALSAYSYVQTIE